MSRYIDAEYVNAFPIRIDHYDEEHGNRHFVLGIESVMEYIEEAPSIDIVRCKACRHCKKKRGTFRGEPIFFYRCAEHSRDVESDDYCSWGERSE